MMCRQNMSRLFALRSRRHSHSPPSQELSPLERWIQNQACVRRSRWKRSLDDVYEPNLFFLLVSSHVVFASNAGDFHQFSPVAAPKKQEITEVIRHPSDSKSLRKVVVQTFKHSLATNKDEYVCFDASTIVYEASQREWLSFKLSERILAYPLKGSSSEYVTDAHGSNTSDAWAISLTGLSHVDGRGRGPSQNTLESGGPAGRAAIYDLHSGFCRLTTLVQPSELA
jgi:hypothetical protein